jgi:hypothetical protein
MENKTPLKILLTIVTIFVIVFLPLWVGPEIVKGSKVCLLCEWVIGVLMLFVLAVMIYAVCWVVSVVYDLWDDIIN